MNPVSSMTGFAAAARPSPLGRISIELRTVNARFLDLSLRIGDELRAAEPAIREAIATRIARGKVDCRVWLQRDPGAASPRLDRDALARFADLVREVRGVLPDAAPPTAYEVLSWPGIAESAPVDADAVRAAVVEALGEAIAQLQQARHREGDALRAALLRHCDAVDAVSQALAARLPELAAALERRLQDKLMQGSTPALAASAGLSREEIAERIRQEIALYGIRTDVQEELTRLATHLAEVRRVLAAGGAVGRRLDFLMQELNRESNTVGSKAGAIEQTNAAVELKLLIEQMREQIQNLE